MSKDFTPHVSYLIRQENKRQSNMSKDLSPAYLTACLSNEFIDIIAVNSNNYYHQADK